MSKALKPKAGGRRGRALRTVETGREVSHEEVLNGLVKKTAVEVKDGAICKRCGEATDKSRKGRKDVLCLVCKVERNREQALASLRKKGAPEGQRRNFAATRSLAGMAKRAIRKRERQAEAREARIAAGLCVLCGKEPSVEGKRRGEKCMAARKRASA